jgi:CspA family cold shock protein
MIGTVRRFDDARGWGFIGADGGPDYFVHHSAILADGHRILLEGQRVEFDIEQTERGPKAINVEVVTEAAA